MSNDEFDDGRHADARSAAGPPEAMDWPPLSRRQFIGRAGALSGAAALTPALLAACGDDGGDQSAKGLPTTKSEITAAIRKEGSAVAANWTYTAHPTVIKEFKKLIKDEYGVSIGFDILSSQDPATYMTKLYSARRAGNPAPFDIATIEENFLIEAVERGVATKFLPSSLVPNARLVDERFRRYPHGIGWQYASPGIVYKESKAPFLKDWTDLSDGRLKKRITLGEPGTPTALGFLLGVTWALRLDYTKDGDMEKAIDYAVSEIGPNVLKYTSDSAEMQQLLRSGEVDAVAFWNSLARLETFNGYPTEFLWAESGNAYINGMAWIPVDAPHPVLAQLYVNFLLSPERQVPSASWGLERGTWVELHEGVLGSAYLKYIPSWIKPQYDKLYPSLEEIARGFKPLDWKVITAKERDWTDYYLGKLGR